jgi:hypothetical protein
MRTLLAAAAASLLQLFAGCTAYDLRAYAGYQSTELSGTVGLAPTSGPVTIDAIDVEQALGLTDAAEDVYLRGEAALLSLRVTGSMFRYEQSGTGTLNARFGDLTVGTPVATDAELMSAKGAVSWDLNLGPLRLSPGVAVNYMDLETTVRATSINAFETVDVDGPIPLLFGQAEVELGPVAATLDVGWIEADVEDVDGTMLDIEALLRFTPFPHLEVFAGYRALDIDVAGDADGQQFEGNLEFRGWMVGGGIRF